MSSRSVDDVNSMDKQLIEKAFLLASNERGLFGSIRQSTCAILFFATPQAGTRTEYYDDVLCNIVDAMAFANTNDRLLEGFRDAILGSIRSNGSRLCQLAKAFHSEAYHLQHISSFVEASAMPGQKDIVSTVTHTPRFYPLLIHLVGRQGQWPKQAFERKSDTDAAARSSANLQISIFG